MPPTKKELLAALEGELKKLGGALAAKLRGARRDCLYEIYVTGLLLLSARRSGATCEARDGADKPVNRLLLRRKPGRICGDVKFGFLHLEGPNSELELHTDVMVAGKSGTSHEIDVAVLNRTACVSARSDQNDPKRRALRILAECKLYSGAIPLHIGREFSGLMTEMTTKSQSPAIAASSSTLSIECLVHSLKGRVFGGLVPGAKGREAAFSTWADAAFQSEL